MPLRTRTVLFLLAVTLVAVAVPACGGGGGGGGPKAAPITLSVLSPTSDIVALPGARVPIRYQDDDKAPPSNVVTSLYAIPVKNPDAPILFASNRPHGAGSIQVVNWDTTGIPAGSYQIEARSTDGKYEVIRDSTGYVQISSLPITVTSPTADLSISRGGFARIDYTANFPFEQALLSLFVDLDADLTTTTDQVTITSDVPDQNGLSQSAIWDSTGTSTGIYHLFGTLTEPGKDPVSVLMPPRFYLTDVGTSGQAGTAQADLAYGVGSFPDGSMVAVGQWNAGHGFFARFRTGGQVLAANGMETDTGSDFKGVLTWPDGTWFVWGDLQSSGILGLHRANQTSLSAGRFWAKFNADGTLKYAMPTPIPAGATEKCFSALPDGGFLVAGTFSGSVTFTTGGIVGTYTSAGGTDIFLARFNSSGVPQWLSFAGGTGNDVPYKVEALSDGSSILLGSFSGSATFGIGAPGAVTLSSNAATDTFLARFKPNGFPQWAVGDQVPLNGTPPGSDLHLGVFPDGSFLVVGTVSQTTNFGVGTATEQTLTTSGPTMYIARFQSSGALKTAKATSDGSGSVTPTNIVTFTDGSVLVVGDVAEGTYIGAGERTGTILSAGGFRARWLSNGSLLFVDSEFRGTAPLSVAGFSDGSFVVAGDFKNSITFGAGTSKAKTLSTSTGSAPDSDVFVVKYNGDGSY